MPEGVHAPDMNTITPLFRTALATSYALLILLPCLLIAIIQQLPHSAIMGTFLAYAFALLPMYHLDHWLLGGVGFHSPIIFALLAVLVATMLWPLPVLSAAPMLWHSDRWRRVFLGYGAALILYAALAAWQMTQSLGLFFG